MTELTRRVADLEKWQHEVSKNIAVDALRQEHMDTRFDNIETKLGENKKSSNRQFEKFNGYLAKIVWLIIGSIIMALMAFLLKGGLNVG